MAKTVKELEEKKLTAARDAFIKQYAGLRSDKTPGGLNGVGIGVGRDMLFNAPKDKWEIGIVVRVESSKEVFAKLPKTFMGFPVYAEIVGKILAL